MICSVFICQLQDLHDSEMHMSNVQIDLRILSIEKEIYHLGDNYSYQNMEKLIGRLYI